jgi:hypothetical protein
MVQLLTVLTPIGLLDSPSIVPLCIVILVVLLAGPNPVSPQPRRQIRRVDHRGFHSLPRVRFAYLAGPAKRLRSNQRIHGEALGWGQRMIAALLTALGIVLLVDGVGWFLGYPLIPV